MNTNNTLQGTPETFTKTTNPSILVFEDLKYFYCSVNGKTLIACIYGHEIFVQNFGLWVSFSDGSHFLMCIDSLLPTWVTLLPEGKIYADAIQDKLVKKTTCK